MRVLPLFFLFFIGFAKCHWGKWASSALDTLHDASKQVKRAASDAYDSASSHYKKAGGSNGIADSLYSTASSIAKEASSVASSAYEHASSSYKKAGGAKGISKSISKTASNLASEAAAAGRQVAAAAGAAYESVGGVDGARQKIVDTSSALYEKAAETIEKANEAVRVKRKTLGEKSDRVSDTVTWLNTVGEAVKDHLNEVFEEEEESDKDVRRTTVNAAAAGIKTAAGTFKQISKKGEPIFKHVSGGDWGMRQVNTAGKSIYKSSVAGSSINHLGNFLWVTSVAMEAYNIADAYVKDKENDNYDNTIRATSKAAGSWVGASSGAATGAAVCSVVPVVGTAVGAIVGGAVGAMSGSFLGEKAANEYIGHEEQPENSGNSSKRTVN